MKTIISSFALSVVLFAIPSAAIADDTRMPVGAKSILMEYDSNKDRKIDGDELSRAGEKNMVTLAKRYDKDKDGIINLSELGLTEQDLKEKAEPKKKSGKKHGKKPGKKGKKGKKH